MVVRVAGLPIVALERLRFEESFAEADEIVRLHARLSAEAGALSDELYDVIGKTADGDDKSALVGLRRSVFRLRMPAGREWNDRMAGMLPAGLTGRLRTWLSTLAEYENLNSRLPATLAAEALVKQAVLREIVRRPDFRRALSYASPTLFVEASKWLAQERYCPRRQSLLRLAKYVARAAAKTSPFSTFTAIGTGIWSESGPSAKFAESPRVECVLELNGVLTQSLTIILSNDPRLSEKVLLRVNPSATLTDTSVKFLGTPPDEPILSVPAVPAVRECLRLLDGGACHTVGELRRLLGDPGDGRVTRFLDHLVEAGLLQRHIPVADLAEDPLGELADWLVANGGMDFTDAAALMKKVRSQLRAPAAVDDVQGHLTSRRALGDTIGELTDKAGLPPEAMPDGDKNIIYENAVLAGTVTPFSAARWRPALEDLDVVLRALAAFDSALPLRVALGGYVAERFGPGARVPFLVLHEAIVEDLTHGRAPDLASFLPVGKGRLDEILRDSRLARLHELYRIRRDMSDALLSPAATDGTIHIAPGVLERLSATWPAWVALPRSIACYLQMADDEQSPRLVLNKVHNGHGRNRSRALHLIRRADPAAPLDPGWETGEDGPAVAEIGGMFGFSPNVRMASVPYEIDYPFTVSGRPAARRIPVGDLDVVHEPGTDLVSLAAKGRNAAVKVLHLGMMADALLPPAAQLLVQAFGTTYLAGPTIRALTSSDVTSVPETVLAAPRIEVGRVVVRRARWIVPAEDVPVRDKGESDAEYLVRLVKWVRAREIPTRCFVRIYSREFIDRSLTPAASLLSYTSRKPLYVDFANWYLVSIFERMHKEPGSAMVFEETLPAFQDALGPDRDGPSVTEVILEISDLAGGQ